MSKKRHRNGAFTLLELMAALAILGFVLLKLIDLRGDAVERVTKIVEERELKRLAQETLEEKLAEFLSDELEEVVGTFPNRQGWTWEWIDPLAPNNIIREGEEYLLACTVRVTHPNASDPTQPEQTYELTTWILPNDELLDFIREQEAYINENEEYGTDPYGTGAYGTGVDRGAASYGE
jgi:prepilin-type N-terminal cleavage/methylation domain-containing protein